MNPMHGSEFPKTRNAPRTTRQEKGKCLHAAGHVYEMPYGWSVLGDAGKCYLVKFRYADEMEPALFECDCADYLRHRNQVTCKHGHAVEFYRTAQAAAIRARFGLRPEAAVA